MVESEFIDQTIAVWQPKSRQELCREDARQIVENMVGFIEILKEWEAQEHSKEKDEVLHAG